MEEDLYFDLVDLLNLIMSEHNHFPIESLKELVVSGEPCIALENLCDNIIELDITISDQATQLLVASCKKFNVNMKYWIDFV